MTISKWAIILAHLEMVGTNRKKYEQIMKKEVFTKMETAENSV